MTLNLEIHNNTANNIEGIGISSFVTAHTEYINYNKFSDAASSKIEYIGSEVQTPSKNLFIKDLSWKHPRNNINYILEYEETKGNFVFKAPFRELYITNIVNNLAEPLYFKHKRKIKEGAEVSIIKRVYGEFIEGQSVVANGWHLTNGYIYNNYENKYNFENGSYELYYINSIDEYENPIHELLSNEESIEEFSWRDIDLDDGSLLRSGYTRNQIGSSYEFNVKLSAEESCSNELNKLFIKAKDENIIKILHPEGISLNNSWSLRIQNGFFFKDKKYYISEYNNQNFDPEVGVIKLHNKQCFLVNSLEHSNVIKLPIKNIIHDPERNIYLKIIVKDLNGNVLKGITSNSSIVGDKIESSEVEYEEGVISVDEKSGFVEVSESILSSNEIFCSFHHDSKDYFLTSLDVNPLYNKKIYEGRYYFYLKPNMKLFEKSIEWLYLDQNDLIIEASEEDFKVVKEDVFNDNTLIKKSLNYFKENYVYGYENSLNYLELGEVSYKETEELDEVLNFNVSDNNPTSEVNFKDYIDRQWKVLQSKYGYGKDGQHYQDNNLIYISSPIDILRTFGGQYTESELYDLLKMKLHVGTDIVFDWDYYDLDINLINKADRIIDVEMSWEGPGTYSLFRIDESVQNEKSLIQTFEANDRPTKDIIKYRDQEFEDSINVVYYLYEYNKQESKICGVKIRS
jgi:hypothetical protein